jgi:hypothetical protein
VIPLRIEGATLCMKAPPGKEAEVRDLHVAVIDGCYVSRWEPTPNELEILNRGGSVELWVIGGQPPVSLVAKEHIDVDR